MSFDDDRASVLHQQLCRLKFLVALRRKTGSRPGMPVSRNMVWEAAGLTDSDGLAAVMFLDREMLLKSHTASDLVDITHAGILEAEDALVGRETRHFVTTVVQNFNGTVGVVQNNVKS